MSDNGGSRDGSVAGRELHDQVVAIFMDIFQVEIDPASDNIARDEIATWDSVNHLRLVTEIEEVFQITLSDEEVTTIAGIRELEKLLLHRGVRLPPG
jgi:acyl carrier protein